MTKTLDLVMADRMVYSAVVVTDTKGSCVTIVFRAFFLKDQDAIDAKVKGLIPREHTYQ